MIQLFCFFLFFVVELCAARLGQENGSVVPLHRRHQSEELDDVFFIEQSDKCGEEKTLADVLTGTDSSLFPAELRSTLEAELRDVTAAHRRRRLEGLDGVSPIILDSFSQLSVEERRDQVVAALDLMYRRKTSGDAPASGFFKLLPASLTSQSPHSTVRDHLKHLGIDIVNNLKAGDTDLHTMAAVFPCLKYPPEKNLARYTTQAETIITPNDNFVLPHDGVGGQWHLSGPGVPSFPVDYGADVFRAWSIYRGETDPPVIAVVDSGCSMHPDLERNLCKKGEDCAGYDFGEGDDNPHNEINYHGTSVAGTVAGVPHNGFMVAGVCWDCKVMCLKIANKNGDLSSRAAIAAMDYMVGKKIKISNHSYAGNTPSNAEQSAIEALRRIGHLFVAAAGNEDCNVDADLSKVTAERCRDPLTHALEGQPVPVGYPHDNIIGVGSNNPNGRKSWFSNYGPISVDLMAPGANILAPVNTRRLKSGISAVDGTSFAAPLTASVLGLILGHSPKSNYQDIIKALFTSVTPVELLKGLTVTGGVINAAAALKAIEQIENAKGNATFVTDPPTLRLVPRPTIDRTNEYYGSAYQHSVSSLFQVFALCGLILVTFS